MLDGERAMATEDVIRDYMEAFEAANGHKPDFTLSHQAGWFLFKDRSGFLEARKRAKEMGEMTARLRSVASREVPSDDQSGPSFPG